MVVGIAMLMSESSAGQLGSRTLAVSEATQSLSTRYGLSVVELPPPPASTAPAGMDGQGCPIELRAVVVAESASDSFAVVATGETSAVLAEGESLRTRDGWVAVSRVAADHALVRKGGVTYRCTLDATTKPR